MTSARDIAARLGLVTGDSIEPPPPRREVSVIPGPRQLTGAERRAFAAMAPAAVTIAGNDGPEPRGFGDNGGCWPILLSVTRSWDDTLSATMDRLSPLRPRRVIARVWTTGYSEARGLLAAAEDYFRERVEPLRGRWLDMGPDCDIAMLELEVRDVARRRGLEAWTDDDLVRVLRRMAS